MQIKRDGNGVPAWPAGRPLPLEMQPIGEMHIDGFIPIIINVTPINLPLLLGLRESGGGSSEDGKAATTNMDIGFVDKHRNKFLQETEENDSA